MTIDEAISRMEVFVRDASEVEPELLDDAIRLSIEALKLVQNLRIGPANWTTLDLPGETEKRERR